MKRGGKLAAVCLALCTAAIALGCLCAGEGSNFSRRVEENLYQVEMNPLNDTLQEAFSLRQGDAVKVCVSLDSGELDLLIGQRGQQPVYEGHNPEASAFQVAVSDEGEYLFSVTGRHARGSVSFQIIRKEAF